MTLFFVDGLRVGLALFIYIQRRNCVPINHMPLPLLKKVSKSQAFPLEGKTVLFNFLFLNDQTGSESMSVERPAKRLAQKLEELTA